MAASVPSPLNPYGAPGVHKSTSREMLDELRQQIEYVEAWALGNRKDARGDLIRFWLLKIPAIAVSASSGIFAFYKLDGAAVIAGSVASLCVLIDGLNPGGTLRNVHMRAFNELRALEQDMASEWQIGCLNDEDPRKLTARILQKAQVEMDRINGYLTTAETSLGTAAQGRK